MTISRNRFIHDSPVDGQPPSRGVWMNGNDNQQRGQQQTRTPRALAVTVLTVLAIMFSMVTPATSTAVVHAATDGAPASAANQTCFGFTAIAGGDEDTYLVALNDGRYMSISDGARALYDSADGIGGHTDVPHDGLIDMEALVQQLLISSTNYIWESSSGQNFTMIRGDDGSYLVSFDDGTVLALVERVAVYDTADGAGGFTNTPADGVIDIDVIKQQLLISSSNYLFMSSSGQNFTISQGDDDSYLLRFDDGRYMRLAYGARANYDVADGTGGFTDTPADGVIDIDALEQQLLISSSNYIFESSSGQNFTMTQGDGGSYLLRFDDGRYMRVADGARANYDTADGTGGFTDTPADGVIDIDALEQQLLISSSNYIYESSSGQNFTMIRGDDGTYLVSFDDGTILSMVGNVAVYDTADGAGGFTNTPADGVIDIDIIKQQLLISSSNYLFTSSSGQSFTLAEGDNDSYLITYEDGTVGRLVYGARANYDVADGTGGFTDTPADGVIDVDALRQQLLISSTNYLFVADSDNPSGGNNTCSITANDDNFTSQSAGGTTPTVFTNDDANGTTPATDALVTTPTVISNGGLTGISFNTDGTANIPAGAASGTYNVTYQICLEADNSVCDQGIATIEVAGPATDTDGDGVPDSIDLDDDNDGILDTVEDGACGIGLGSVTAGDEDTLLVTLTDGTVYRIADASLDGYDVYATSGSTGGVNDGIVNVNTFDANLGAWPAGGNIFKFISTTGISFTFDGARGDSDTHLIMLDDGTALRIPDGDQDGYSTTDTTGGVIDGVIEIEALLGNLGEWPAGGNIFRYASTTGIGFTIAAGDDDTHLITLDDGTVLRVPDGNQDGYSTTGTTGGVIDGVIEIEALLGNLGEWPAGGNIFRYASTTDIDFTVAAGDFDTFLITLDDGTVLRVPDANQDGYSTTGTTGGVIDGVIEIEALLGNLGEWPAGGNIFRYASTTGIDFTVTGGDEDTQLVTLDDGTVLRIPDANQDGYSTTGTTGGVIDGVIEIEALLGNLGEWPAGGNIFRYASTTGIGFTVAAGDLDTLLVSLDDGTVLRNPDANQDGYSTTGTTGGVIDGVIEIEALLGNLDAWAAGGNIWQFTDGDSINNANGCDTDGDGIINSLDLDSDNDGINDVDEANGTDTNRDGFADGTPDALGRPVPAGLTPPDSDNDNAPAPYDVDSDDPDEQAIGDGINDDIDGGDLNGANLSSEDANGDGRIDDPTDPDGDGILLPADNVPAEFKDGPPSCSADAGTLTAAASNVTLSGGSATISATPNGDIAVPAGYETLYVLTSGAGLVIEQTSATPSFTVNAAGNYTIHTLVAETSDNADPDFLDLSIVVPGTTTGFDVNGLLQQGGGSICGSLDVAGTPIAVTVDTDGDGIPNSTDIDDDNDGILDTVECQDVIIGQSDFGESGVFWFFNNSSSGGSVGDKIISTEIFVVGSGLTSSLLNTVLQLTGADDPDLASARTSNAYVEYSFTTANFGDADVYLNEVRWNTNNNTTDTGYKVSIEISDDGFASRTILNEEVETAAYQVDPSGRNTTSAVLPGKQTLNQLFPQTTFESINDLAVRFSLEPNTRYSLRLYIYDSPNANGAADLDDVIVLPVEDACVDTDGDGVPDSLDLDSDNDGAPDTVESVPQGETPIDSNGDGVIDATEAGGFGPNGLADNVETTPESGQPDYDDNGVGPDNPADTDGDTVGDWRDLDSDNDGINDVIEDGNGADDLDGNGQVDPTAGSDPDGDGIQGPVDGDDANPGSTPETQPDTDGDSVPDIRDLDSDNDGINDVVEGPHPDGDTNGDGQVDGPDADSDGIQDPADGDDGNFGDASDPGAPNSDSDPVPDYQDLDSDNDGDNDVEEGPHPAGDTDGDGQVDGPDSDGDGIQDPADGDDANFGDSGDPAPPESDGGTPEPDFRDPGVDSDGIPASGTDPEGDGILDSDDNAPAVFGDAPDPTDTDGDGIPDNVDIDDDNDGILDTVEGDGAVDTDGDGIPDSLDLDSDNDGAPDTIESVPQGETPIDTNGDGVIDATEAGGFGPNGLADNVETTPESGQPDYDDNGSGPDNPADTDGDTVGDWRDLDSDNDGINDVIEDGNGADDPDGNGQVDPTAGSDPDGDGIQGPVDGDDANPGSTPETQPDTDGDSVPDIRDLDSDNDGINDVVEGPHPDGDTNGDGQVDGPDADGDGIQDPADGDDANFGDASDPGAPNSDSDPVPDYQDLDSDNDGDNDVEEGPHPAGDTDGDGQVDGPDSDGDGIQDPADGDDANFGDASDPGAPDTDSGTPAPDFQDPGVDSDGIPASGTDPDGDGILSSDDNLPAAFGDAPDGTDTDGDGIPDADDIDDDNDGILDTVEGDGAVDTDGDGVPDSLDLDSDNDGAPDTIESVPQGETPIDTNADGVIDATEAGGFGPNGLADNVETTPESGQPDYDDNGVGPDLPVDTDGDTVGDWRDLDSDNDGINDVIEDGNGMLDPDGNGIVDPVPGSDPDGDGIQEPVDGNDSAFGSTPETQPDTDGDTVPDIRDLDSDNDGINDVEDGGNDPLDADNNGLVDGSDDDGDGILNPVDGNDIVFGDATDPSPPDTDGDDVPDFQDLDSDNDGINDVIEGGSPDPDGDGLVAGPDADLDGIQDPVDGNDGVFGDTSDPAPTDTDNDNVPDYQDLDSDNDTINDVVEGGNPEEDPDGNGIIDPTPGSDPDGDGIQNPVDGAPTVFGDANDPTPPDSDGGLPDYQDGDDGTPVGTADPDGDGIVGDADDAPNNFGDASPDTDGDGIADSSDLDDDNDGIPDTTEGDGAVDTDGDGTPDSLDLDTDNDGILDVIEAGHGGPDADGDGQVDGPVGVNGLPDAVETAPDSGVAIYPENTADTTSPIDTDGDTVPDWRDLDSDNDGINDVDEGGNPDTDTDGDGLVDGPDTDGDGINDPVDGNDGAFGDEMDPGVPDTDGDDVPDFQDLDSDNDGINDVIEGGNPDPDGDGQVAGPDNDGDGIQDPVDGDDNNFGDANDPDHLDTDGDNVPDSQDLDSDNDTINDVDEGGNSASDPDGNGIIDPTAGSDPDGDGIQDPVDGDDANFGDAGDPGPPDTDVGSPEPDFQDGDDGTPVGTQDPDGDGIVGDADDAPDTFGDAAPDTDGDGVADNADIDDDNDGIPDSDEGDGNVDTDGDGVPDSLDLDTDNDGILDLYESGAPNLGTLDPDGDGVIDTPVGSNGLANSIENNDTPTADITYNGGVPVDTDGDNVGDWRDLDSDNDGINDIIEGGNPEADTDGDGIADGAMDPDGDGVLGPVDTDDGNFGSPGSDDIPETDGDTVPDFRDLDSDDDGINDVDEGPHPDTDTNGDGMVDGPDSDGDGIQDPADGDDGVFGDANDPVIPNTDSDVAPDYVDLDSDNDGINDVEESGNGPFDTNGDGLVDGPDNDGDGIQDPVDGDDNVFGDLNDPDHKDTDGDNVPDSQDLDSDNDGINDVVEGGNGASDPDNNGVIDPTPGSDPDEDGIQDPVDGDDANFGDAADPAPVDTDNDNVPDYQDLDSDDDSILDITESGNDAADPDGNGVVNGPDTDGDGIQDAVDEDPTEFGDDGNTDSPGNSTVVDGSGPVFDSGTDNDGDGIADSVDGDDNMFGTAPMAGLSLDVKVRLQGALLSLTTPGTFEPLMRDDLRSESKLPATEPYTALPNFTHVGSGGGETIVDVNVLNLTGNDAIVDWVFVELHSSPGTVVDTRAGLVQRDGDVVDVDGVSPLLFTSASPASYYVAVRHRNHIGTATDAAIALSSTTTTIDFISLSTGLFENDANFDGLEQITINGAYALWAGNTTGGSNVIFAGQDNDKDPIFNAVDQAPANIFKSQSFILNGYYLQDVNMSGEAIFAGQNNDVDPIFNNVDGHPNNVFKSQSFVIPEQLP